MSVIAVGWRDIANALLVYNHIAEELYTTLMYKIDEHNATRNYFNLTCEGGVLSDLYSIDSQKNSPEHYLDPLYTIQLIDGSTSMVPAFAMENIIDQSADSVQMTLPSWLQHDAKVRYTIDKVTH